MAVIVLCSQVIIKSDNVYETRLCSQKNAAEWIYLSQCMKKRPLGGAKPKYIGASLFREGQAQGLGVSQVMLYCYSDIP